MRFSLLALATLSCTTLTLAAPLHVLKRSFLSGLENGVSSAVQGVSGVAKNIAQSVENPKLTAARLEVLGSLGTTQAALSAIGSQASATNNAGVTPLVATAQGGLSAAGAGVGRIGESLVTGQTPSKSDQKDTAIGIKQALDAINNMTAAVTTPDDTLSAAIKSGQSAVAGLQQGGKGVLSASGLTLADLGLPDNFLDN